MREWVVLRAGKPNRRRLKSGLGENWNEDVVEIWEWGEVIERVSRE